MNKLDAKLEAGLAHLRARLANQGRSPDETDAIAAALSAASFPGLLAFLAGTQDGGEAKGPLGEELLAEVAGRLAQQDEAPREAASSPSPKEVAEQLRELLGDGNGGIAPGNDQLARGALLRDAVAAMAESAGFLISDEEARQIATLLLSGEFYGDVADASAVIVRAVPTLPIALTRDVRAVHRLVRLPQALARDLDQGFFEAVLTAGNLIDGDLDREPHLLRHTLRVLYDVATVESTFEMIRALIDPSNESVRLAIVLYARANGVDLEPGDLDLLRRSVLNPQDPDLGPALVLALGRLEKREGPEEAGKILRRLARRRPATS